MNISSWLTTWLKPKTGRSTQRRPLRVQARRDARNRILELERLETRGPMPAAFIVNTTLDTVAVNPASSALDANGKISLRSALMAANAQGGDDSISLPAGTYNLTRTGSGEDGALTGDLDVLAGSKVTLTGAGAATTIIDAATLGDRVFHVLSGADLALAAVTIRNGGGTSEGGGIDNVGTLTLTNGVLSGNRAGASGGGIFNGGTATIIDSTIANNQTLAIGGGFSTVRGGAICNVDGAVLTVSGSTLAFNQASAQGASPQAVGGALFNRGMVTLVNSTIADNTANGAGGTVFGGGLHNEGTGTLLITNSTISGNQAAAAAIRSGGGFDTLSSVTIRNTIVAGNTVAVTDANGAVTGPATPDDIDGNVDAANSKNNLIGNASSSGGLTDGSNGNIVGNDGTGTRDIHTILNTALANNGGPTQTLALVAGSPALDHGANALAVDAQNQPLTHDQRGAPRIGHGTVDIGAFEFAFKLVALSATGTPNTLVFFEDSVLGAPTTRAVTGLAQGETLLDLDVLQGDNGLYAVSDRNRIYAINTTTGAATRFVSLSTGLNDGMARTLDNSLGLFVDSAGFFEQYAAGVRWLRGINNAFSNPWYFITAQGDFFAWNGGSGTPTGALLASFGTDLYQNPERLYAASSATLSAGQATAAQAQDETLGLYVDARGYFQDADGNNVKYLRGASNAFGNPWYFLQPNGDFVAWNGVDTAGAPLASFAPAAFLNPELLYQASRETLTGADLAQAQTLDGNLGLYVDARGYFQSSGTDVKWLRGTNNAFGNPWYFIRPTGAFVAWSGGGLEGTLLYTFPAAAYRTPELIYQASSATLSPMQAASLDQALGLHVDPAGFYQGGDGNNVKYLRGTDNVFGNPWYFLRPNGDFVAWNGNDTTGAPISQFTTAAFLNAELVYEAYGPPLSAATFDGTNKAGIDFDPVVHQLRIVTDNEQNLHQDPFNPTGSDAALHYASAADPNIVAAAYSNNFDGAATTVLYDIDSATDMLVTQDPATGLLTNVGALGVDASEAAGVDIAPTGEAFAVLTTTGHSHFYVIDLATGLSTDLGAIGAFGDLRGLAVLS